MMMNFIRSKWNFCNTNTPLVYGALFRYSSSSTPTPTPRDSLFLRLSRAGDPATPMARVLDQWVEEGRDINQSDLKFFIKRLKAYRRFNHALQISEWMSNERNLHLLPGDIALRLDLISKVHGLDQAERYFNSISDTSRDFKVYGALLNCYAEHKSVEKAEAIMQKIREYASKHETDLVVSYTDLLKLYARMGQYEKLDGLMQEMKEKNICDTITLTTRLNAYVAATDIDGMEKLLIQMEADPLTTVDWITYYVAANGYLKAGHFEKSLVMLRKSEQLIRWKMRRNAYESLITMYAAIGKKDDVYRIWNMCKKLKQFRNSSYLSMLTALVKLDDIDGAERILEEWESGNTCYDSKIPNVMMSAYCTNGLMEKAEAYIGRLLERDNELDGRIWDHLARGYYKCNDMDNAVQTMKKAILAGRRGWKPDPFTLAACIEHMKDKGDLDLTLEILRICAEQGHLSAATYDRLLSYVHGEIPETKALNLMKGDYHLKADEASNGEKQHEM